MTGQIERLRFAAEDDHVESMFLLGAAYAQGKGVPKDDKAAASWFHKAARKGHARAQASMGFLYATGRGVRLDLVLAYLLLSEAAEQGDQMGRDLLIRTRKQMHPMQLREAEKRVAARH
jgi:TPR repeat protein